MEESTGTEKRKSRRIKTHIPVRYRTLRGRPGVVGASSITKDLSEGGIRFRTAEFIAMSCRLILELDIPMFTKPIKAISKVAWLRKLPSGEDYDVGNQFLEMSKENKKLVSEYVDSFTLYNDSENTDEASGDSNKAESGSEEAESTKETSEESTEEAKS